MKVLLFDFKYTTTTRLASNSSVEQKLRASTKKFSQLPCNHLYTNQ